MQQIFSYTKWTAIHRLISCHHRFLHDYSRKHCFITTPIFYVNAEPHIGHLYTLLLSDAMHRFHRLLCPNISKTIFSTGTDEHGLKVQKAAASKSLDPLTLCDQISPAFERLAASFDVNYTRFIRTTEQQHKHVVHSLWEIIDRKGLIYKAKYEGWYCLSDETFVTSVEDAIIDGKEMKVSSESKNPVEWTCEENYMFKMSEFSEPVLSWLTKNPSVVQPKKFHDMVHKWVSGGLHDLSISRPRSRLDWGIVVPGDETQTIYVWMEALFNYLTVAGYGTDDFVWPPTHQIVGKDIIKFHAIYWPSFLMAIGLEMPSRILTHSHWTISGFKMSKSKGNVVSPFDLLDVYGSEGIRYYLLREGILHEDGNFNPKQMKGCINSELSASFGNLLSRCTAPAINPQQIIPSCDGLDLMTNDSCRELVQELGQLPDRCRQHYEDGYFNRGIEEIMKVLRLANGFIAREQPWLLVKKKQKNDDDKAQDQLNICLLVALETIRVVGILLQPIVPKISSQALDKLNISPQERLWIDAEKQFDEESSKSSRPICSQTSALLYKTLK